MGVGKDKTQLTTSECPVVIQAMADELDESHAGIHALPGSIVGFGITCFGADSGFKVTKEKGAKGLQCQERRPPLAKHVYLGIITVKLPLIKFN